MNFSGLNCVAKAAFIFEGGHFVTIFCNEEISKVPYMHRCNWARQVDIRQAPSRAPTDTGLACRSFWRLCGLALIAAHCTSYTRHRRPRRPTGERGRGEGGRAVEISEPQDAALKNPPEVAREALHWYVESVI